MEVCSFRERAARGAALEHTEECAAADSLRKHGFDQSRDVLLVRERERRPQCRSMGALLLHKVSVEPWQNGTHLAFLIV